MTPDGFLSFEGLATRLSILRFGLPVCCWNWKFLCVAELIWAMSHNGNLRFCDIVRIESPNVRAPHWHRAWKGHWIQDNGVRKALTLTPKPAQALVMYLSMEPLRAQIDFSVARITDPIRLLDRRGNEKICSIPTSWQVQCVKYRAVFTGVPQPFTTRPLCLRVCTETVAVKQTAARQVPISLRSCVIWSILLRRFLGSESRHLGIKIAQRSFIFVQNDLFAKTPLCCKPYFLYVLDFIVARSLLLHWKIGTYSRGYFSRPNYTLIRVFSRCRWVHEWNVEAIRFCYDCGRSSSSR